MSKLEFAPYRIMVSRGSLNIRSSASWGGEVVIRQHVNVESFATVHGKLTHGFIKFAEIAIHISLVFQLKRKEIMLCF